LHDTKVNTASRSTLEDDGVEKLDRPPAIRPSNTIRVLDGLRAIATLSVIAFHIGVLLDNNHFWDVFRYPVISAVATFGGSGVTLFFVLSGFLLFLPYAKSLLFRDKWPSARQFYLKRALRIIPAYYVALLLIVLFFQRQYLRPDHWGQLGIFLIFFMDSTRATFRQLNGPFWTLAIEWQFYMLLPLIALGFLVVARRLVSASPARRLSLMFVCCGALITWGLLIRFIGEHFASTHASPLLSVPMIFLYGMQGKYLENFAVGMTICLCYTYAQNPEHGATLKAQARRLSPLLGGVGLLLLLFAAIWHFYIIEAHTQVFAWLLPLNPYFDWLNEMVIALGYGFCMAALLFGYSWLKRPFEWMPLCWIGFISYGLYMWHLPLLDFFHSKVFPLLGLTHKLPIYGVLWLWAALVIVPVAFASYRFIEQPWLRLASRSRRKN
jgi:peptidoglycan/LPS O-acetylase OafA/YrhL